MNISTKILLVMLAGHSGQVLSADLKDPYTRDDDISGTLVSVEFSLNAAGHFEYIYSIKASSTNTGKVLYFSQDISCDEPVGVDTFVPEDYFPNQTVKSEGGYFVPVALEHSGPFINVSANNELAFFSPLEPGASMIGIKVVSPYPPGARNYKLVPSVDYKYDEYDYSILDGSPPDDLPWIDDWTVSGVATGPACPGEEYDEGVGERFAGSMIKEESEAQNQLLSYLSPLQDKMVVDKTQKNLELQVYYSDEIDPKSFSITPNRDGVARLFHPVPGAMETVQLPLRHGKNQFKLQIQSLQNVIPNKNSEVVGDDSTRAAQFDQDVFVIRVQ